MNSQGGWSTRELAELAGTTPKTVRYYHQVGLLAEPERAYNGYKQYRLAHLIRLLRIRRLVELGVSPAVVAAVEVSGESVERKLRAFDAALATDIERQERIRAELASVLRQTDLVGLPPALSGLTEADRAFGSLNSRIFVPWVRDLVRELLTTPRTEAGREFDELTEESDEQTRRRLAARFAPPSAGVGVREWSAFLQEVSVLCNSAQMDVLHRIDAALRHDESTVSAGTAAVS